MSSVVSTSALTFKYGSHVALDAVDLNVREGSLHALLGPNGSGKTTLLKILMGMLPPMSGTASVLGKNVGTLSVADRAGISYVAEGQELPGWMRLRELEAYLAPMYAAWDRSLADSLRERFNLDPGRRLRAMSRGERMKAALLCALAPRPKLMIMDEPFTGMDVMVKDELVRGLLESAGQEGWSVLIASHDIAEVELVADSVTVLRNGRIIMSEAMEGVQDRYRHVDAMLPDEAAARAVAARPEWLSVSRAGARLQFINAGVNGDEVVRQALPNATRVETRPASLREVFVAVVKDSEQSGRTR